ncbi:type II toxin-antitoxin system HicA family toxin [Gloeocapsopsis crepidinum LEGE 06123]|uniref:Type II toxin-antitoxin system HicA family toxin n=1 Tax=Gloeocapsopsis crepidinum LEGE 06123 TaxID=588587 RepID=A0ABR9UNG4_9CHRO|nr:type II toxin-antitoxin system HicA family toxin [Gloeocapsopsis crepidinum LEGE 06123]
MPRLPRISSREAIKALERLGFVQVRQTGSHVVIKSCKFPVVLSG